MTTSKNPEELLKIMKAAAMGDKVYSHILEYVKVGMSEKQVADEIERVFKALGSGPLAFPTICVSGERTNLPHGEPSDKTIEIGDFVTLDIGGSVDGYCGDMTRTFAMGEVTEKQQEVYDVVLQAQLSALDTLEVGASCKGIDKVARDIISEAGYGEYYIHGTGHGVGKEVHEKPYLNTRTDEYLESDVAVTIEPGIYIPNGFGVRIEDLAIVTEFGIINAVKSEKNLIIL